MCPSKYEQSRVRAEQQIAFLVRLIRIPPVLHSEPPPGWSIRMCNFYDKLLLLRDEAHPRWLYEGERTVQYENIQARMEDLNQRVRILRERGYI